MISAEQNELMTRIGPGTPAGKLLRRYWQPVALVDEMQGERPVKAVRLLRRESGSLQEREGGYGLMQRHCPHRGADLAYGRIEPDGLRCSFHGWKFDADGQVPRDAGRARRQPAVRAHQDASPIRWSRRAASCSPTSAQAQPPAFPHFDCFVAPDAYTFAFKGYWDCNWLQALEVGIDPAHASWLHKYFEDEDPAASYGKQFRGAPADSDLPISKVLREYDRPEIRVERTDYGMRLQTLRRISDAQTHIRVTNILFPQAFVIPMNAEMTITQFHVPVDDTGCYWYSIFTSFGAPVDKDTMRSQRLKTYPAPDYKPIYSSSTTPGASTPRSSSSKTFTGMGFDINIHDQFACESQGAIPTAPRRTSAPPTRASCSTAGCWWTRSARTRPARSCRGARRASTAITGPPAIDGIGPTDRHRRVLEGIRRERGAGSSAWAA